MKKFRRFLSAILSVIMILGLVPLGQVTGFAASAPTFSLNLVSETDSEVKVSINLDSGSFLAADATIKLNTTRLTCTQVCASDELLDFESAIKREGNQAVDASYKDTMKCSVATTAPFNKVAPIFIYTFKKSTSARVTKSEINLVFDQQIKDGSGNKVTPTVVNKLRTNSALLAAPTLKSSNVASTGKNKLEWNSISGAVKYNVYRATSSTGSYKLIKTTTELSFINSSANAGSTYYYKVCAVESDGSEGTFSSVATRTCDYPRPVNVKVSGVASTGKNKITWNAVDGATKYKVYRATSKDGSYTLMKTTSDLSYVNSSAVAGTKYYYKVKACGSKSAADSAYSSYVARTCDYARPVVKISGVEATGKIKLSWNAVSGATEYKVYRSTSKDGTYSYLTKTTKTSLINSSAVAGTKYYYKVKACGSNSEADSALSSYKCRTCDLPAPVVTASVTSSGKPKLTWAKVDGAVKYQVYRATSADGTFTLMKTTTDLSYTNTTVTSGTTYYYKVKAVHTNTEANSAYSAVVNVKAK